MAIKFNIKVGNVEVEYEGPEAFVNKKLPELVGNMVKVAAVRVRKEEDKSDTGGKRPQTTLPVFLKQTKGTSNQTRKFLATAVWLHSGGSRMLTTRDVSKTLKDTQQGKLGNPADCLNKNVGKGFCEKDGKQFYATGEGRKNLGINDG